MKKFFASLIGAVLTLSPFAVKAEEIKMSNPTVQFSLLSRFKVGELPMNITLFNAGAISSNTTVYTFLQSPIQVTDGWTISPGLALVNNLPDKELGGGAIVDSFFKLDQWRNYTALVLSGHTDSSFHYFATTRGWYVWDVGVPMNTGVQLYLADGSFTVAPEVSVQVVDGLNLGMQYAWAVSKNTHYPTFLVRGVL